MNKVDNLYVNTTNRLTLCLTSKQSQQVKRIPIIPKITIQNEQLLFLEKTRKTLEENLLEAQQQQKMMLNLFTSICKIEKGESNQIKKYNRRCAKDIIDRFYCSYPNCNKYYSSKTTLQRHAKIKHRSGMNQPPQLYRDLPPQPNLKIDTTQSSSIALQSDHSQADCQL